MDPLRPAKNGRTIRAMRWEARVGVYVAVLLSTQVLEAGGSAQRVTVREFARQGKLAAKFTLILAPDDEPLLGCKKLEA
jgi:hypothetical protein